MTDQPLAAEAPVQHNPDMAEPGPSIAQSEDTVEVNFIAGLDEETGEYQLGLSVEGLSVAVHVKPEGFDALGPILQMLPQFVEQAIEQVAEQRDHQIETTIAEETP